MTAKVLAPSILNRQIREFTVETAPPKEGFGMLEAPATAKADPQASDEEPVTHDVPSEASQISRDMEKGD